MDTNNAQQNNAHINSFTKGMNSDTSLDMVSNEQYLFGKNIRITNNALLGADSIDSNSKEGIVTPVLKGNEIRIEDYQEAEKTQLNPFYKVCNSILASASIGDVGVIIVKDSNGYWYVYRLDNSYTIIAKELFKSTNPTDKNKFSIVLNKELENCTNVYIADGEHQIMQINIDKQEWLYEENTYLPKEEDFISNIVFPTNIIKIVEKISGSLKTSQVQYTYRLYAKYGNTSRLAPLTRKIQVIDSNRNKEIGNAMDTTTSIGFKLKIEGLDKYPQFDHVQVFRISYIKPNQDPEIDLIYDARKEKDIDFVQINDEGIKSIQGYSVNEFSTLNGQIIVPQIIEQNQNYMFVGNIKDQTVLKFKEKEDFNSLNFHAYRENEKGQLSVYKDTTYENGYDNYEIEDAISNNLYLEKYADINVGGPEESRTDYGSQNVEEYDHRAAYVSEKSNVYYGGIGKIVSWKFITTEILLHGDRSLNILNVDPPATNKDIEPRSIKYIYKDFGYFKDIEETTDSYFKQCGIFSGKLTYNDLATSSLFRSLKRNEVYRYGILFYDNKGRESNVYWIGDIRTPSFKEVPAFQNINKDLYARPIGIEFSVNIASIKDLNSDIIGYQIVRCEKTSSYTKNLLQCALSRPVRQSKIGQNRDTYRTPYYPHFLLTTQFYYITAISWSIDTSGEGKYKISDQTDLWYRRGGFKGILHEIGDCNPTNVENNTLFQIFSPQIDLFREQTLSDLNSFSIKLTPEYYSYGNDTKDDSDKLTKGTKSSVTTKDDDILYFQSAILTSDGPNAYISEIQDDPVLDGFHLDKSTNVIFVNSKLSQCYNDVAYNYKYSNWGGDGHFSYFPIYQLGEKPTDSIVFYNYSSTNTADLNFQTNLKFNQLDILNVSDVKLPTWENGFSKLIVGDSDISSGVKQYKTYNTGIGIENYVNWVANGKYDYPIGQEESEQYQDGSYYGRYYLGDHEFHVKGGEGDDIIGTAMGFVGPGPSCMLINTNGDKDVYGVFNNNITFGDGSKDYYTLGSLICNITHNASQFAGLTEQEKQYDIYYGFGNTKFFKDDEEISKIMVFDGDTYITPCEFVTMFKTYDFTSSLDSLISNQVIYYIPLESKVNTYFDYGMNYMNTRNKNLQLEPGEITGITRQDRPLHQYNPIYSENSNSIDVYTPVQLEDSEEEFPTRICYSQLKTNGETIDNWQIFKATDFIDADTRYGQLTNMLTQKETLFFWQEQAFGRLSVNERSLVTDNNSNTIQLGQGGVLQRTDYLNTRYGMKSDQYVAVSAENMIFWIDMQNKAVVQYAENVTNYGESCNVKNIIHKYIDETVDRKPEITYDMENFEVICDFLKGGEQLIFNIKLNAATSVYTRRHIGTIYFSNVMFGINKNNTSINAVQYNYLKSTSIQIPHVLTPVELSYVVNTSPSITKVFDNQEIVTMKRTFEDVDSEYVMQHMKYTFSTNIKDNRSFKSTKYYTNREGNIKYAIPRVSDEDKVWGERMRGKWMKVDMKNDEPNINFTISHIITNFRQSFS